jgi:hypothetical protein
MKSELARVQRGNFMFDVCLPYAIVKLLLRLIRYPSFFSETPSYQTLLRHILVKGGSRKNIIFFLVNCGQLLPIPDVFILPSPPWPRNSLLAEGCIRIRGQKSPQRRRGHRERHRVSFFVFLCALGVSAVQGLCPKRRMHPPLSSLDAITPIRIGPRPALPLQ